MFDNKYDHPMSNATYFERGYYTRNLKLSCFLCYLKIIYSFVCLCLFWKVIYTSQNKLSKELNNGIEI